MKMIKIGYFADGPWSHGALDLILESDNFSVEFICARYDSPDQFLKKRALDSNIKFLVLEKVNTESSIKILRGFNCDIFVSMSFNQIFRGNLYRLPPLGTINCHAGKLPFYRGRNILNWALINDEKEFGISVHYVDDGVDTGDLILQRMFPIGDDDDYSSLLSVAYRECPLILFESLKLIYAGSVNRIKQKTIHPIGSIFSQRIIGDEFIDWSMSSRDIFNFVRALATPGPCAQTKIEGQLVYIKKVALLDSAIPYKCIPGGLLAKDGDSFLVKTGDSLIRLLLWDSEAKLRSGMRFHL